MIDLSAKGFRFGPEHYVPISCNRDCGAGCPLAAVIENGVPVKIVDNPLRPPELHGCARGYRALDSALSPERLTVPLKRSGPRGSGQFTPIGWDQALDEIAEGLERLHLKWGTESLLVPPGSGTGRGLLHSTVALPLRLFKLWGRVVSTRGWYSNTASNFAVREVFGTLKAGVDAATLEHSRLIILWGFNARDTRFGTALDHHLKRARDGGIPIWVVDPRQTASVRAYYARWVPVLPGGDSPLMAAFLHHLLTRGAADRSFLERYTHGFDELEAYILGTSDGLPKSAAWASPHCGLSPEEITGLADQFCQAVPAAILPGLAIQRTLGGEEAFRLAAALQAATGNTGRIGGSSGCCMWNSLDTPPCPSIGDTASGPEPVGVPINLWAKAVLGELAGAELRWSLEHPVKGYYGTGSNYLIQSSELQLTRRAFEQMELVVVHELFKTPTARIADYLLPATHYLENRDIIRGHDNYLFFSEKVLAPPGEARSDWEIFSALAGRLGLDAGFAENRTAEQWLEWILDGSSVVDSEAFLRTGIFDGGDHHRLALGRFLSDPDQHPLATPSGRIDFISTIYREFGLPEYPTARFQTQPDGYPLRLITPHARFRVNSQNSNIRWAQMAEKTGLHLHPEDAAARDIGDGDEVVVHNQLGELRTRAVVTEAVRPGVVWMIQGGWTPGEQVNLLTSTESTLPSAGSRTNTVWVEVTAAQEVEASSSDTEGAEPVLSR